MSDAENSPQKREQEGTFDTSSDIYNIHEASFREQQLPEEGNERGPWWLYAIIIMTFAFGFFYMGLYFGEFSAEPHLLYTTPQTTAEKPADKPEELSKMDMGKNVYGRVCQTCHQANGKGVQGAFPSLHNAPLVTGDSRKLTALIQHGLQGELQREDAVYNGVMPPWKDQLSDEQVAAVATYVRQQFENDASKVSAETVQNIRSEHDRSVQWTESELNDTFDED